MTSIRKGAWYSNGSYGHNWGVRWVEDLFEDPDLGPAVRFKGMAGRCRRKTGLCSLEAFQEWARYEVALNETSWQRILPPDPAET